MLHENDIMALGTGLNNPDTVLNSDWPIKTHIRQRTDASQEVHRSKMAQVKPESKEILSSYNCVSRRIFWRRKGCCFDILVMTQMDLSGKQAPEEHCSVPG